MTAKTELITTERETRTVRPGGGMSSAWASVGQMWAEASYIGGGEGEVRGAVRETVRYRFVVWSAATEEIAVTPKDRLIWNGVTYNIREMPRRLAKRIETEIIAESGVTQ